MAESLPFATTLPSTTRAGSVITLYSIIFIKSSSLVITASKANSFTTCSTVAYRALQPAQPVPNTLISIIYKFIILNVIRKTTNINVKKGGLSATLPRFTDTLPEKLLKEFTSQLPILSIDTVFHFRRFNLSLYKPRIFQLFKVLRYGSFGYGKFFVNIPKITRFLLCQKVHNSNSGRMSQCFGKSCQLFLRNSIIFLFFHISNIVRKYTNNIRDSKFHHIFFQCKVQVRIYIYIYACTLHLNYIYS